MENEKLLLERLDQFIRKYYKNQLIRGALILAGLLGALYLLEVLLEYSLWFGTGFRSVLFYAFILISSLTFGFLILKPALNILKIGKILGYEDAAKIIGTHFPEIGDKLLNTLQLLRMKKESVENLDLLLAGIDQKIKMIKPFPFTLAVNLKKNLKYLKYALPPILLILSGFIVAPSLISKPAERILKHNTVFVREYPYRINLLNKEMVALQQEDFELKIQITGDEIPADAYIRTDGVNYKMIRQKNFVFSYVFKSVQEDLSFRIEAGDLVTREYRVRVFPKPIILSFTTHLAYPGYIRRPAETLENTGDLSVPEGTVVTWELKTRDVDQVLFRIPGKSFSLRGKGEDPLKHSEALFESMEYKLIPENRFSMSKDSLIYRIQVIKDGYPVIYVEESSDSALAGSLFFRGSLKDDYGFTRLLFHYEVYSAGDSSNKSVKTEEIAIEKQLTSQIFFFTADLAKLIQNPGDEIKYFFEVWDNDGVNGPKATRSEVRFVKTLTREEIASQTSDNEQEMIKDLEGSRSDAKETKKAIEELSRKLVDKSSFDWQEKKRWRK